MKEETSIQNLIRISLSKVGIVIRNNVGYFLTPDGRIVYIGVPGLPDLTLFAKNGIAYFIEVKTQKGKQTQQQKKFQKRIEALGFTYLIMRDVSDAERLVTYIENNTRN